MTSPSRSWLTMPCPVCGMDFAQKHSGQFICGRESCKHDWLVAPLGFKRAWRLSAAVTAAEWAALLSFLDDVRFGLEPFFYYDPFEPASGQAVGSNFDDTGVSTQGRYTVVLRDGVEAELNLPRGAMGLQLVEVA